MLLMIDCISAVEHFTVVLRGNNLKSVATIPDSTYSSITLYRLEFLQGYGSIHPQHHTVDYSHNTFNQLRIQSHVFGYRIILCPFAERFNCISIALF